MRIRTIVPLLALLAVAPATQAAAQPGSSASEQLEFGVRMAKRGLWKEALFRFRRAQQLDGRNARVLNNLAVAYEALGEFELALETYREALAAGGGTGDVRRNYSQFLEFYQSFQTEDETQDGEDGR